MAYQYTPPQKINLFISELNKKGAIEFSITPKNNYIPITPEGPRGKPNIIHTINNNDHPINKATEYGSIVDIIVPIPDFLSYFSANETIKAKYVISGDIIFVVESPILYAI